MSEQFAEQYKLLLRAKKLEQMGSDDRALELYLQIHSDYTPNTSDSFERPVVILEKKRRYQEALELCYKAIQLIEDDKISGTKDKFQRRINIIESKLQEKPVIETKEKVNYKFGIIGFRSHSKYKRITSVLFYLIFIIIGVLSKSVYPTLALFGCIYATAYFVDSIQTKADKKTKIKIVTLLSLSLVIAITSFIRTPDAFTKAFDLRSSDNQESLDGGSNIFKDEENLPLISEANISASVSTVMIHIEVEDALILVNGSEITFGLLLDETINKEVAINIADEFVDSLSHLVANDLNLRRPSGPSHGELYDYYNIVISAGSDENNIIIKGKKSKSSKFVTWID